MSARFPSLSTAAAVALSLLFSTVSYAQQKQRLREAVAAGDVVLVESTWNIDARISSPDQPAGAPPLRFQGREREKYTYSVLAAGAKGPTAVRYVYEISRNSQATPSGEQEVTVSPVQGKTVVVKRVGGKVVVTSTPGKLSPEDRKGFLSVLDDAGIDFFPAHEVAPGDEWTAPAQWLGDLLPPVDNLMVKARFEEVVQHRGHPCVRVRLTVTADGPSKQFGGSTVTANLTGTAYLALDLQRALSHDLSGPVSIKSEPKADGEGVAFRGEGRLEAQETYRWLKIAGKPVPAK